MQTDQSPSEPLTHIIHTLSLLLPSCRLHTVLQLHRKPVSLELEFPAHSIHGDAHNSLNGCQDHLEQQECNDGRRVLGNISRVTEGREDGWGVQERREECKDGEDVQLGDEEHLGGVHEVPMAKFMRQYGFNFLWLALLNEGIEDDDVLAPGETKEVGVAVGASL